MHILYCNAKATLIVPKLHSAAFWPIRFARRVTLCAQSVKFLSIKGDKTFSGVITAQSVRLVLSASIAQY